FKNKTMQREEALAELARRYFKSRGPATIKDFIWWSGLLVADARAGLEAVKSELIPKEVDNQIYWYSESTEQNISPMAHLLPTYDEYLFGYQDRGAAINKTSKKRLEDLFRSTIAIDGQIVGTWKRILQKGEVILQYDLFRELNRPEKEALTEAERRYHEFMHNPKKS
ncbi:MAG TPA: crosslink repair DNA glycosylase YcaQ family protein, partial [Methanobacteriaceae archaeon]|nr:crosslink repair DNA glycosylase YcaQ family protein [Methanobacteriaceae archaeon]